MLFSTSTAILLSALTFNVASTLGAPIPQGNGDKLQSRHRDFFAAKKRFREWDANRRAAAPADDGENIGIGRRHPLPYWTIERESDGDLGDKRREHRFGRRYPTPYAADDVAAMVERYLAARSYGQSGPGSSGEMCPCAEPFPNQCPNSNSGTPKKGQPGSAPHPGQPGAAPCPGQPGAAPRPGEPGWGGGPAPTGSSGMPVPSGCGGNGGLPTASSTDSGPTGLPSASAPDSGPTELPSASIPDSGSTELPSASGLDNGPTDLPSASASGLDSGPTDMPSASGSDTMPSATDSAPGSMSTGGSGSDNGGDGSSSALGSDAVPSATDSSSGPSPSDASSASDSDAGAMPTGTDSSGAYPTVDSRSDVRSNSNLFARRQAAGRAPAERRVNSARFRR